MAKSRRFLVIAECVDQRTGKRFSAGDEFLPAPTAEQARRLTKAGCLEQIDGDAPDLPTDDLGLSSDEGLAQIAAREQVDVSAATDRDQVIELIRTARAAQADRQQG